MYENIESLIFNLNSNNSSAYFQPPSVPHRRVSTAEVTAERSLSLPLSFHLSVSLPVAARNNKKEYAHDQNVV